MNFFTDSEKQILINSKNIIVAYSGGADSTLALLSVTENAKLKPKVSALHINHNKSSLSDSWEKHCKDFCKKLDIKFLSKEVEVKEQGQGFEAAARNERRVIFESFSKGSTIILGHHADDQIETILFRIFRGTAIKGLSGMSRVTKYKNVVLVRPLLHLSKNEILQALNKEKVNFIFDQSNEDDKYSRNYIRNQIIPLVRERWGSIDKNVNRMTRIVSDQNLLYEQLLRDKMLVVMDDQNLSIEKLKKYSSFLRSEIIRLWLSDMSFAVPNERQMKEIEKSFFESRQDSNPVIKFNRDDKQNSAVILSKVNNFLIAEKSNE